MKVRLRCSYKSTQAAEELEDELRQIELENATKTPKKRPTTSGLRNGDFPGAATSYLAKRNSGSLARNQFQNSMRPYSAKTDFTPTMSRNPNSRRNFSNRMMSSQHVLHQTASMRTLPQRPQTAATFHVNGRVNNSIGRLQSMSSPYGGGPKTVGNFSAYRKSRHNKKKLHNKVEDLVFEAVVNEEGNAIFEEIPKTSYLIEVSENDFFKASQKSVCLPQEAENENKIDIYLPVDRQDAYTTAIYMTKKEVKKPTNKQHESEEEDKFEEDEDPAKNYHENLEVRAILLELYEKKNDQSDISHDSDLDSEVDYEEELDQHEDKNGKFINLMVKVFRDTNQNSYLADT
jgi:hypothetical protein